MTIVELREKRAKLWATMEGFLDTHRDRKGVLSAEDDAIYANMEKELNDLTNEVRRMERRDAIAAELAKPVSSPITEQPQKATGEAKTGRASNAYREDFGLHLRGKRMLHNVLSEGVDANGGYLVPTEFEKFIVDTLKEENVMRRLCKVITTDNERKIPVAATHSTAAWTAENTTTSKEASHMSKAQGQFTIIDYNDALTLTGYIGSNLAKTQMYNPDNGSYTPDWKTKNLVLTPSLYVIGTTADQIATANVTSVKWYVGDSNTAITAGANYALSGAKSHILTVKANVMAELPGIDYRCVITYKDESTGLSLTHPLTISFSRVVNGSGIVDLLVTTPNGNVFKNEEVASLTAKAELWRGSTVDTTKVSYKWAVMDTSVTATSSTGYDADFGIGWRKLSDTADKYTGTATNTLTVYAAAVDSYAVFKCCAQDTDSASASYNTKFFDVATFIDNSDPLQIIVTSTGGDVFKNGQGTTVLTAVCYQAGSEVDAAGNGSYTWTKYNKDGVVDTSWGTNGSKTGKTLSVSSADVDTKATFMVVVAL